MHDRLHNTNKMQKKAFFMKIYAIFMHYGCINMRCIWRVLMLYCGASKPKIFCGEWMNVGLSKNAKPAHKPAAKRVAIIGARGYSGLDLARILLRHPEAELVACFANDSAFALADYLPEPAAKQVPVYALKDLESQLPGLDCVFLATPAEASLELAPRILLHKDANASVIDLSGAFRLQAGTEAERLERYEKWYKAKHTAPALLEKASYGLVPFAKPVTGAKTLVSNPGCYATAVLMGIIPLLQAKAVEPSSLVIDAKSGTSGAGRKASEGQLFTEVDGECLPYRVGKHQHLPEIQEWAKAYSGGVAIDPFFSTHLLPVRRGIIASIYAELHAGNGAKEVGAAFRKAYADYPLARITQIDGQGDLPPALSLSLKRVSGSARVHISYQVVGKKLYLFSLIDNLLKGAASQAVENFNSLHDFPAALGLEGMEGTL
jgi:N-acetyl-gamma-glutamyl-phosphate reductase